MPTSPRRRFLAAATTALVAAGGLAACGGGSGTSGGHVTLTLWTHTHPPMIALFKTLVAEYEKAHPNVTVKYQTIPNTEFGTKMLTALSNGSGPDIINMDDAALRGEYIPKRLVAPIDPKAFGVKSVADIRKRYEPHVLDGATGTDGTLYGVTSELDATAFVINTKHFKDAGLNPDQPPRTWDDVGAYGKKLYAAGHKQAFNFSYIHSGFYHDGYQTLLHQTGGSIVNGSCKQATVNQPKSVQAMQIWQDLAVKDHIANPNTASREATAPFQDIATGVQSMALTYPWAMQQIKQSNPKTYKQLKVVPVPQVDPAHPVTRWYGYDMAVNQASKQQLEAWRFIAFATSKHDAWLSKVGFYQGQVGMADTSAAKAVDFASGWDAAYTHGAFDQVCPHWSEVQDDLKDAVDKVVFDGVAPQTALNTANQRVQSSIG